MSLGAPGWPPSTNIVATDARTTSIVVVMSRVPMRNHGSLALRRSGTENEKRPAMGPQPYPRHLMVQASPCRHDPRFAGVVPVQGRRRVGSSTSARRRACASACRTTSATRARCTRARRRWSQTAESVEWTTVRNEVEALMLEYSLIKQHQPRFNIRLRDDKSYPFLAVTVDEQWPRALVMRGRKRKGTRYFGPYAHAYAIRDTLDELLRSFPIRTCSPAKFSQHERLGRPCLLFHIEKCSGPCVGEIDDDAYRDLVAGAVRLPRRRHRPDRQAPRRRDAGRGDRRWSSSGRPASATA